MILKKGTTIKYKTGSGEIITGKFDEIVRGTRVYAYWNGRNYTTWTHIDNIVYWGKSGLSAFLEKTS